MKKINLLLIIIFSTVVSIGVMLYYSSFAIKAKYYESDKLKKQAVVGYKKDYIPKDTINNDNQGRVIKKVDEETSNVKEELEKDDLAKSELSDEQKSSVNLNANPSSRDIEKNNWNKDMTSDIYALKPADSLENDHYNAKQQEQSVFKVSTGKIEESLTTSDKIKLLYVSFQLGKENYKKVKDYLYEVDAEDGVLKALKLLKEELSKKEYEKVRKIAGKFIDMDAAEMLK
ncbi:hypothetical protein G9F72_001725 [Clostridium estertheticum]|uniref:hypothetical protein n=1 Tax=Clostridium estertheticum TaxID=238834 RepID=UPI0013E98BBE|nr:hypothetical protein [Clostridium estertheticum]MBZ9685079.1 hypothetical protein [Clostridium estertheticum]